MLTGTETLLRVPFSLIGRCLPVRVPTSHWLQGKCARINLSWAASGMIIKDHRRLPVSILSIKIPDLGSVKRLIGRIFKFSKLFKEQAKTLSLIFSSTKKQKIVTTISACTESTYLLLEAIKTIFIS
jgi:hypothetical protein